MDKRNSKESLEVAMLPLGDGRQVMLPLQVLAEVRQIRLEGAAAQETARLSWRGQDLPVESFDDFCGLPGPDRKRLSTVGIFKADGASSQPFRALAFCGNAAHGRIEAADMEPADTPAEGYFVSASRIGDQVYLVPDLKRLLFASS